MELAEKIKLTLQQKLCPVHDIHPIVEVIGNELNIACCCTYFHSYCNIEARYLSLKLAAKPTPKDYFQAR